MKIEDQDEVLWKNIDGYDGHYIVSNTGEIVSLPRSYKRSFLPRGSKEEITVTQSVPGRTLKRSELETGYEQVSLCKDGVCEKKYVHEIVARAFIGPRPEGMQICHGDGNGANNKKSNLRYDLPVGNAADRHKHGTDAVGVNNPMAKYSEETIRYVKTLLKTHTQAEVARIIEMPPTTVRSIKQEKIWSHITV